jgi:hypothetical protein
MHVLYEAIDAPFRAHAQQVLRRAATSHTGAVAWRPDGAGVDPLD